PARDGPAPVRAGPPAADVPVPGPRLPADRRRRQGGDEAAGVRGTAGFTPAVGRHLSSPFSASFSGGRLVWWPVASWYAFATASSSDSPHSRPVNVNGCVVSFPPLPLRTPLGTTTVGWPVRFEVSSSPPKPEWTYRSTCSISLAIS